MWTPGFHGSLASKTNKMKKTIYKGKSKEDLVKALGDRRETLRNLRFGSAGSKTRDVKVLGTTRKDIARIMTELSSTSFDNAQDKSLGTRK